MHHSCCSTCCHLKVHITIGQAMPRQWMNRHTYGGSLWALHVHCAQHAAIFKELRVLLALSLYLMLDGRIINIKIQNCMLKINQVIDGAIQYSCSFRQKNLPITHPKICRVKLTWFATIFRGKHTGLAILWGEKRLVKYNWNKLIRLKFKCNKSSQQAFSTTCILMVHSLRAFNSEGGKAARRHW